MDHRSSLLLLLAAFVAGAFSQQEKLTVSVFYETLCPDSIRFITTQLYPQFAALGGPGNQYFNIDFVPYGKANTTSNGNGDYTFVCQHGNRECEGNKMHACALKHLPAASREAFINCSMSSASPPDAGPSCANSLGLNFTVVQECISTEGPALLAANGNRTHSLNPALYYVPWILYNGDFTVEDLTDSQSDFLTTLCKKLGSSGPSVCNPNAANLTVSVFYETLCPDSIRFITTQLFPTFSNFGGFGNSYFKIDFVPYGKAETTIGTNGSYSFECQHGPRECAGNVMHACALRYLPESAGPAFINCSMSSADPPSAGPACAEYLAVDFAPVEACINNDGTALLAANGNRTHTLNPALYFVPWVLYDGVFSETDLNSSLTRFEALVCDKLGNQAPGVCNGAANRRARDAAGLALGVIIMKAVSSLSR